MNRFDGFLLLKRYVNRRREKCIWKRRVCERRKKSKKYVAFNKHNKNNSIIRKGKSSWRRHSRMGWRTGIAETTVFALLLATNSMELRFVCFFDFTLQNLMTAKWSSFVDAFFPLCYFWQVLCAASSPACTLSVAVCGRFVFVVVASSAFYSLDDTVMSTIWCTC